MLAEAVAPYGGTIIWRCFVYNCQQDWRDEKTDRARAGYDNFAPLNGQFAESRFVQRYQYSASDALQYQPDVFVYEIPERFLEQLGTLIS